MDSRPSHANCGRTALLYDTIAKKHCHRAVMLPGATVVRASRWGPRQYWTMRMRMDVPLMAYGNPPSSADRPIVFAGRRARRIRRPIAMPCCGSYAGRIRERSTIGIIAGTQNAGMQKGDCIALQRLHRKSPLIQYGRHVADNGATWTITQCFLRTMKK